MKLAIFRLIPIVCACAFFALLSGSACFQMGEVQRNDNVNSEMNVKPVRDVDFRLVEVERPRQAKLVGHYAFTNKTENAISIPWVTFESEGAGVPNEVGFEVFIDGEWKNPGYYRDAIPLRTTLDAGKGLILTVDIPAQLWDASTPFRLLFGTYVSVPARLDEISKNGERP